MEATFEQVLRVALHVKAALDALGLESYPKTSGATGVQIFVPIEAGYSYEQTRGFVGAGQSVAESSVLPSAHTYCVSTTGATGSQSVAESSVEPSAQTYRVMVSVRTSTTGWVGGHSLAASTSDPSAHT